MSGSVPLCKSSHTFTSYSAFVVDGSRCDGGSLSSENILVEPVSQCGRGKYSEGRKRFQMRLDMGTQSHKRKEAVFEQCSE